MFNALKFLVVRIILKNSRHDPLECYGLQRAIASFTSSPKI